MNSFVRVGAAVPVLKVADCIFNRSIIIETINLANDNKVNVLTFPELSLTGYSCADLFLQTVLLNSAYDSLNVILDNTKHIDMIVFLGMPVRFEGKLFNCAVAIHKGMILGVVPKIYLPNYREFYEKRWFYSGRGYRDKYVTINGRRVPFGADLLFLCEGFLDFKIGVEICEDLWAVIPPSSYQCIHGATIVCNLSASNEAVSKASYRRQLVSSQSAKCFAAYVYSSAGMHESTTDLVFSGHSIICENGYVLSETKRFRKEIQLIHSDVDIDALVSRRKNNTGFSDSQFDLDNFCFRNILFSIDDCCFPEEPDREINPLPFVPQNKKVLSKNCEDIFNIQICGLAKRIMHVNAKKSIIGVSGGLDSTLALLSCVKTYDFLGLPRKDVLGITMPGFGTSNRTYKNAIHLMSALNISQREISIKEACIKHFEDIQLDDQLLDVTFENAQARERTQILMDIANKENGIVIGTGDLSESALGYTTYNGDHMSMYGINAGIPKTLVRVILKWVINASLFNEDVINILSDILETPVSPELLPPTENGEIQQKTEELVGPYDLHDFFIFYTLRYCFTPSKIYLLAKKAFKNKYENTEILKWLKVFYKRFISQQFKRSCMPDGPKVGSVALSPRGDLKLPSDASVNIWLTELETVKM